MLKLISILSLAMLFMTSCAHSGFRKYDNEAIGSITLIPRLHFAFDSDKLTPEGRGIIYHNAGWMKKNPAEVIILEGHCDSRGSADYNLYLGDRRARVVRAELLEMGVDGNSLTIVSYGEERPLAIGRNRRVWQKNRRVEFVVR